MKKSILLMLLLIVIYGSQQDELNALQPSPSQPTIPKQQPVDFVASHNTEHTQIIPADLSSMKVIGQVGGEFTDIALSDDYAFVGVGLRVKIFDISTPTSPVFISQTEILNDMVVHIELVDNLAYIADSSGHLYIFDISNPIMPNELSFIDLYTASQEELPNRGQAMQLQVQGIYAYIVLDHGDRSTWHVIDITNPTSPQHIATHYGPLLRIDIVDNTLYSMNYPFASPGPSFLKIFDITDPALPIHKVTYELPVRHSASDSIEDIQVVNQTLYYVSKKGLYMIDLENPMQPVFVGYMALGGNELSVDGDKVYIRAYADSYYDDPHDGFYVVDVSDRTNPFLLAYQKELSPLGMAFSAQRTLVTTESSLHLIDIGNIQNGFIINQHNLGYYANNITVNEQIAYVAAPDHQLLQIFDVANPNSPVLFSQTPASECGEWTKVDIIGSYAYFHQESNLCLFDISNPQNPTYLSTIEMPRIKDYPYWEFQIAASEQRMFVVVNEYDPWCASVFFCGEEHYTSIYHLNMMNPQNPSLNTIYSQDDISIGYLEFANNHLFLAINHENYGGHALRILDVSNLTNPQEKYYGASPEFTGFEVMGNRLFASADGLLQILDIQDASQPLEIGRYENSTLSGASSIIVEGNSVILTNSLRPYNPDPAFLAQLDISDLSQIQLKNKTDWYNDHLVSTTVANGIAYMLEGTLEGDYRGQVEYGKLVFVDINQLQPLPQSIIFTSATNAVKHLAQDDGFIYTAGHKTLSIFNTNDPTRLSYVGGYQFDQPIRQLAIADELIYIVESNGDALNTLHIIDVSNPQEPVPLGKVSLEWHLAKSMIVLGDYVYIGTDGRKVVIIDAHDVTDPVIANTYYAVNSRNQLELVNGFLYLLGSGDLEILDLSNPIIPVQAAHYTKQYFDRMTTNESLAYLKGYEKFIVWDITNPISPTTLSETQLPAIYYNNEIIYNHDVTYSVGSKGISAIDVYNPRNPIPVAFSSFPYWGYDLAIIDHNLYVAALDRGLLVVETPLEEKTITLSTEGGILESDNNDTRLEFPSNAFSDTVELTYLRRHYDRATEELVGIKHLFEITAVSTQTNLPVNLLPGKQISITLHYTDNGTAIEDSLALYFWDGQQWVKESTSTLDLNNKTLTATVDQLGIWAVLGETHRMWQPVLIRNSCPQQDETLELYLPLNEPKNAITFHDLTCYAHHGTCSGDSCPTAGAEGVAKTAVQFDGNNDVILLDERLVGGDVTFAAWIKPEATNGIRNIIAHGYGPGASDNTEVFFRINNGQYEVGSWNGTAYMTAFAMPQEDLNTWVHLTGVYDGTHWRLYRNGREVAATETGQGAFYVEGKWSIGAHRNGTERFFQGSLDEVYIFDRALSANEIETMYEANQP